jgi:2-oxoisovalerate dehydrogenase E1 component
MLILTADKSKVDNGESHACIITYGMGVYWAKAAGKKSSGTDRNCRSENIISFR